MSKQATPYFPYTDAPYLDSEKRFFSLYLTACDVSERRRRRWKKIMQIGYTFESFFLLLLSSGVNAAFVYINDWSGAYSIDCHWNLSQCFRSICVCVQPATGVCVCEMRSSRSCQKTSLISPYKKRKNHVAIKKKKFNF